MASSKSLTDADSHVNSPWSTPTDLLSPSSATSSYNAPAILCDSTYGAWYNYAAATAGEITSNSGSDATRDICPKGWRLPSKDFIDFNFDYLSTFFNPVTGGYYYQYGLTDTGGGYWWTSTYYNNYGGAARYSLYYNGSSLNTNNNNNNKYRYYGLYVRCYRS